MAKCGIITLTEHSDNVDNFSLYSDADGYTTPFETGISRAQLLAGYQTILIPDAATVVRVRSTDVCVNYVDVGIVDITPTPTVSATPAASPTPPISPSPTPSTSPGLSPTPTPSVTPSISVSPSPTPSISVSATPTPTPSITPTEVLATTEYSYRALYPCADPLHCEPDYSNNCGSITWWDEYGQEQYDDEICSDLYNDETPYVVNSSQTPVVVAMVPV